jgi:hypothetical protein
VELVNNCRRFPDETWRTNWASSNKKRTYHRHRWRISRKAVAPCVRQQGREMQRSARTARRGAPVRSRVIPSAGRARHVARWSAVNVVVPRRAGASIQPTARLLDASTSAATATARSRVRAGRPDAPPSESESYLAGPDLWWQVAVRAMLTPRDRVRQAWP